MNAVIDLINEARKKGANFILENNRLFLQASNPLPDNLVTELRNRKTEIQQYLIQNKTVREDNWLEEEWVRINIPCWRRILRESIEGNDKRRELYARQMLREVLEDPEYKENLL